MKPAFTRKCHSYDYRYWSPEDETGMSCLLGVKVTYKRKHLVSCFFVLILISSISSCVVHFQYYYSSKCYNGENYDRPVSVQRCRCTRFDYECSEGFRLNVHSHSLACLPDPNAGFNPYRVIPICVSCFESFHICCSTSSSFPAFFVCL